jgi:hypothetical protein
MRKQFLDGSIDKIWLMAPLFLIPPYSILPILLIKFGIVKKAKVGDPTLPIDTIMLLPILTKIFLPLLVTYFTDEEESGISQLFTGTLIPFLAVFTSNMKRRYDKCNKIITKDSIGKALIDSVIIHGITDIIIKVISIILQLIPMTRTPFLVIKFITDNLFENILWAFTFISIYIIVNTINQIKSINLFYKKININDYKYCDVPISGNKRDMIPFQIAIVGILITIITMFISPSNDLFNLITNLAGGPIASLINKILKSKVLGTFMTFIKPKYISSVIGPENYETLSSLADPKNIDSLKTIINPNTLDALKSIANPNTVNALKTLGNKDTIDALNILSNKNVIANLAKLSK